MQIPVRNTAGEVVGQLEVSDALFGVPFNEGLVHQAMVRQLANARQGTSSAKTRGEVSGSTKKLYRQKGTGNARPGSIKSPLRRGGGVVFPPKPRDYRQDMPKAMRRAALRSVVSEKLRSNELIVVDAFNFEVPRTKDMVQALVNLGVDRTALVVTPAAVENIIKSARNIPGVKTLPASQLNVGDILAHRTLLMEVAAVKKAEELWGKTGNAPQEAANATA